MTGMELFLIMVGIVAIIGSFVFSERLEKADKSTGSLMDKMNEEAIQEKIEEVVDRMLDEKVEATEVKIEKIMNEKIMTVGDYSDNVIADIQKSHEEIMFLYGMLNDKEKDVKKAVLDVESLKKSIKKKEFAEQSAIGAGAESKEDREGNEKRADRERRADKGNREGRSDLTDDRKQTGLANKENRKAKGSTQQSKEKNHGVALSAKQAREKTNHNQKILELYEQGKSSVEIAKELKLGIGEVRLVIDLYMNR